MAIAIPQTIPVRPEMPTDLLAPAVKTGLSGLVPVEAPESVSVGAVASLVAEVVRLAELVVEAKLEDDATRLEELMVQDEGEGLRMGAALVGAGSSESCRDSVASTGLAPSGVPCSVGAGFETAGGTVPVSMLVAAG